MEEDKKQKNDAECVECPDLISEIQQLKNEITELQKEDKTDECENLRSENAQLGTKVSQLTDELCKSTGDKCKEFSMAIQSIGVINAEINKSFEEQNVLLGQIESNRCEIVSKLASLNQCVSNGNAQLIHVHGEKNKDSQQSNGVLNPNSSIFRPSESTAEVNNNQSKPPLNETIITKDSDGNFLAPEIPNSQSTRADGNKIMTIYVGRFRTIIQEDDIIAHIMQKTGICDTESFLVEKLTGLNEEIDRKTYVSFKISTFSKRIHDLIIDSEVWGPNQSARPFKMSTLKKNRFVDDDRSMNYRGRNENNTNNHREYRHHENERMNYRDNNNAQNDNRMRNGNQQNSRNKYTPPPRFNKQPQYNQHETQHDRNKQSNNNGENRSRYQTNQTQSNRNKSANGRSEYENRKGHENKPHNRYSGKNRSNDFDNRSNASNRQNSFLDMNAKSTSQQQNPLRRDRDQNQYGSTNSVYRV